MRSEDRRRVAVLVCCLGILPMTQGATALDGTDAVVTVLFHDLQGRHGCLRVSLYARAEGFPGDEHKALAGRAVQLQAADTPPSDGTVAVTFEGLSPGRYAVSAYRDANDNGRLDTDRLGRPREDWGASNDPRPLFRAPRFQEASFTLKPSEKKVISLVLRR